MAKQEKQPIAYGDDDMTRATGWDSLFGDLFGLNTKALSTVWVAIRRPTQIFEAARDPEWEARYTPSIRLAFSLIAVTVFLRFLWVSDDSPLVMQYREILESTGEDFGAATTTEAVKALFDLSLFIYPFTYMLVHGFLSALLRIWGKSTPSPVRIRLYFICLIPSLLGGIIFAFALPVIPETYLLGISSVMILITFLLCGLIHFFGSAPRLGFGQRLWRSPVLALSTGLGDNLAYLSAMTIAIAILIGGAA